MHDGNWELVGVYCYIDYSHSEFTTDPLRNDFFLHYFSENDLRWGYNPPSIPPGFICQIWDQQHIGEGNVAQNKNGFVTTTSDNGIWLNLPHIATDYNDQINHISPGLLLVNLIIDLNHSAIVRPSKNIEISNGSFLKLLSGSLLTVGNSSANSVVTVNESGLLWLTNSNMYVTAYSGLIFRKNSNVSLWNNGHIYLLPRSSFCNEGANITGYGNIHSRGVIVQCGLPAGPCYFRDSVKVILEDTASFEIPDSTYYIFEGKETALICNSLSTIKFGKGSKLVFNDGARIYANNTKFTSVDSNEVWDGIYINDVSYDTLLNCTFENALNGVNIADNTSMFDVPAVEISNCIFSNNTGTRLLNQVYVNNASNVMIRECNSSSLISEGFASGIILEYCSSCVNVIDNDINYVTSGINVIQSSPYIARNTITGPEESGNGIYLDNSNGTIEYNTITNFENSMLLYYSSPYVLKNRFIEPYSACTELTAYSVPVTRPIISGTTLRWLGGNNYFSGSPVEAGITMIADSYPLIDSGYNVVSVGNSLYMQGTVSDELKARVNNWYDTPPQSNKFDVSGGDVDYSEYFDGTTIPGTDYYELNSIGFGLYDTVYVDDLESDLVTPEEMFITAYRYEMEERYSEAITSYKNVVSTYKTSTYAVSSLSRIFNCLEKMNAGIGDYNTFKTYYTGLKTSNNYPVQVRELAEDLGIKSKVRMDLVIDAITDYETIISNFPNTPKAVHAQLNKICLENMLEGGGDMIMNGQNNSTYKSKLLTLLNGKEINTNNVISNNMPKQFRLYQNYPNPFNPMTTIKYEIPKDANIKLTVYDITGREIISINEYRQAGVYTYTFDGSNLASGVYIYKVTAGDPSLRSGQGFSETKKMVLIK